MSVVLLIMGLLLFVGLIVAHEWGHFIMARRGGVEVEEFGIGFPPRLFKKRTKGGWLFTVNLLPLGGFVKLKGEHDTDTQRGSFGAASLAAKTRIMIAGVAMNLVVAYVLLVILALVGMPQLVDNQFVIKSDATYTQHAQRYIAAGQIESGSPAAQAGIKPDDALLSFGVAGHMKVLVSPDTLPQLTSQYAGKQVQITYRHSDNGPVIQKTVTLRTAAVVDAAKAAGKQIGYFGVSVYPAQTGADIVRSTWSAPIVAAGVTKQFTILTFEGLGKALAGLGGTIAGTITGNTHAREVAQTEASSQVTGPVGIFFVLKYGSTLGIRFMLFIVAIISLTLAIMNVLPIPALDGGRLWMMLISRALRHPLSAKREEAITATGFFVLIGLIVLVTIVDVRRFF